MKIEKIDLKTLLEELQEIKSDWMDDTAYDLIGHIRQFVDYLRQLKRKPIRAGS